MSSYLVGHDHVDLLVSADRFVRENVDQLDDSRPPLESPTDVGAWLLAANATGAGVEITTVYQYRPVAIDESMMVQVLKAARAFEYQCSRASTWQDSGQRAWLAALQYGAVTLVPGYADAAWNWVRPPATPTEHVEV